MLQYLNIILDDSSASYCHYEERKIRRLIDINDLKAGVLFSMMENLMVQFVYPKYQIPKDYLKVIESIDHFNIRNTAENADVCIVENWDFSMANANVPIVVKSTKHQLFRMYQLLGRIITQAKRINIVIKDIETFDDEDFEAYKQVLDFLSEQIEHEYLKGKSPQLNLLTDRMMLSQMNNCGAGETHITLAPNGKFYICPAFYYEDEACDVGDIERGLIIKNKQLYTISHSPICRHCDAWQCWRCVWLNRKTTSEINTPSHEQCVIAHLERNASRNLLRNIRKHGIFLPEQEDIKEIDYLDPFDKREEWL